MLDQQIKRSKVWSTDQTLNQKIKSWINRSEVSSTDQKLDLQIKSNLDANLDAIFMWSRCNIDPI